VDFNAVDPATRDFFGCGGLSVPETPPVNFRTTLLLLFALLLLSLGYWGMNRLGERQEQQAQEARRIFQFDAPQIERLSIEPLGAPRTAAERVEQGVWLMTAPSESIPAFQPLWERVAQQFAGVTNERTVVERTSDLGQYGLEDPALVVKAETGEQEIYELQLGSLEPTQRFRYARLNEGPVFLVSKNSYVELDRSLFDMRHKFVVDERESPILHFSYVRIWTGRGEVSLADPPAVGDESVEVVLERADADSPWRMIAPVEAPANHEQVQNIVNEIQYAVGRDFVDSPESLSDYGLDPPQARITVQDAETGLPQVVLLGDFSTDEERGGLFVKREDRDAVFVMDAHLITELPRTPDALRERRLLGRAATDLRELHYTRGEEHFVLRKDEENTWRMAAPELMDTNQVRVSEFISQLFGIQGVEFFGGGVEEHGLDTPDITMVLHFEGEEAPVEIRMGPDPEHDSFIRATQEWGSVVRVPEASARVFRVAAHQFRSRELMRFDNAAAREITLELDEVRYRLEKVHGRWLVREPAGHVLQNQRDAEAMLDAVNPLLAAAALPETGEAEERHGLDTPALTLSISLEDEEAGPRTLGPLRVGAPAGEDAQQRYASYAPRDGVFRIRQDVVEQLREAVRGVQAEE